MATSTLSSLLCFLASSAQARAARWPPQLRAAWRPPPARRAALVGGLHGVAGAFPCGRIGPLSRRTGTFASAANDAQLPRPPEVARSAGKQPQFYAFGQYGDLREYQASAYMRERSKQGDPEGALKAFEEFYLRRHRLIHVGPKKGRRLDDAVKENSPLRVLELGSYIGYSAIRIARLLNNTSHLYSVEENIENARLTEENVAHAGLSECTTVLRGTAKTNLEILRRFAPFDLVFLDHKKSLYVQDLRWLERHAIVQNGTVVVADNIGYRRPKNSRREFIDLTREYTDYVRDSGHYESRFYWGHKDGIEVSKAVKLLPRGPGHGEEAAADGSRRGAVDAVVADDVRRYWARRTALEASRSFDVSNESSCTREICAIHDEGSVVVYQAYSDDIADMAAKANSFRAPLDAGLWKSSRMTWIKPSAVWMAYRCGWTTMKDKRQSRVLALHLRRESFEALLMQAQLSHGPAETRASEPPPVVVQWDPEREMDTAAVGKQVFTRPLRARSIQIGLRGPAVEKLLDPGFVVKIEDVTQHFRAAAACLEAGDVAAAAGKLWPRDQERPMSVPSELRAVLAMGGADEREAGKSDRRRERTMEVARSWLKKARADYGTG